MQTVRLGRGWLASLDWRLVARVPAQVAGFGLGSVVFSRDIFWVVLGFGAALVFFLNLSLCPFACRSSYLLAWARHWSSSSVCVFVRPFVCRLILAWARHWFRLCLSPSLSRPLYLILQSPP